MIDNSLFSKKKVIFHTLGCKLNFAESSYIGKQLIEEGYTKVRRGEEADVCIINSCSVTDAADHKCRQAINRLKRQNPNAKIIVTGCYAQLKPNDIQKIDGVDMVVSNNKKFEIGELLANENSEKVVFSDIMKDKKFFPSYSQDDRTRYFLKIQDGCDYYCSFCTIPFARGRSRSATVKETMNIIYSIVAAGGKEIVLTGINTGDFGRYNKETFFELVKEIENMDNDVRFRISSIEPNLLTDEMIQFIAKSRHFMPHFHIPLQGGTDKVLKIMKRRYDTKLFADKVAIIKKYIPNAFIGVDTIVGIRGESDELFEEGYKFISSLDFSQLHVFTYSERAGTKMLEIEESVSIQERKRRSKVLHELSEEKTTKFYESQIGSVTEVLWESKNKDGKMYGFSSNYVKVESNYEKDKVNTIQKITLGGWNSDKTALIIAE